jgi:hypothetical protein
MSSENSKSIGYTLLGVLCILLTFNRFFQNSYIGTYQFIEMILGLGLSIYLFNKGGGPKKNEKTELYDPQIPIDMTSNDFKSDSNFSSLQRIFATFLDFVILSFFFGFSFDYLCQYTSQGTSMIICFIAIFILLYSFMQFKNWGTLNLILKKRIVKNNGNELTFINFIQRTIVKILVLFGYTFLISLILFPPMSYFDQGLTPVDKAANTLEINFTKS